MTNKSLKINELKENLHYITKIYITISLLCQSILHTYITLEVVHKKINKHIKTSTKIYMPSLHCNNITNQGTSFLLTWQKQC